MNEENTTQQAKTGEATPNKGTLQSYVQNFTKEAIDAIVEILRTTRNEALKMGAAKVIIDKSIPDVRAIELTGKDGQPLQLSIKLDMAGGYIPQVGGIVTTSTANFTGSAQVQGADLAQESKKDNNSNNGIGETGTV